MDGTLDKALEQSRGDFENEVGRVCRLHEGGLDIGVFRSTMKELCVIQSIEQYVPRVGVDKLNQSDFYFLSGLKKAVCKQIDTITEDDIKQPEKVTDFVVGLLSGAPVPEEQVVVKEEPAPEPPPATIRERIARVIERRRKKEKPLQTAIVCFDCRDLKDELQRIYPWNDVQDDPHITLAFLGDTATLNYETVRVGIQAFVNRSVPVEGVFNGVAKFSPENGETPVVALFDSPQLPDFRRRLVDSLPIKLDETHGFTPHMTISYSKDTNPNIPETIGIPMTFDRISLWWGSEHEDFQLTNDPELAQMKEAADILRGELDAAVETFVNLSGETRL